MKSFRRAKWRNWAIFSAFLIGVPIYYGVMSRYRGASEQVSWWALIGLSLGMGGFVFVLFLIDHVYSGFRLRRWCAAHRCRLVTYRTLQFWEMPDRWNITAPDWDEVIAFECLVNTDEGESLKMQIAWHRSFTPNPEVIINGPVASNS